MQNYYTLLGVPQDAPLKEINAALRKLVRRYNEESAIGKIDSGEALKLVNVARVTFADPKRRSRYNEDLAKFEAEHQGKEAEKKEKQPVVEKKKENAADLDNKSNIRVPLPSIDVLDPVNVKSVPDKVKYEASRPSLKNRPAPDISSDILNVDSVLTSITLNPQSDHTNFTGNVDLDIESNQGLESLLGTSSKTYEKRSTDPNPPLRFAARFIDYGLWGILLWLGIKGLEKLGFLSEDSVAFLINPFLAPIIITVSWALIESIMMIYFPKTPGKYLLNIHVAATVNNPFAGKDPGALLSASFLRAFLIWWRGIAGGIFPFYFFTLFKSRKTLLKSKEASWDFESDSLVTHGRVPAFNMLIAILLLAGFTWAYTAKWKMPFLNTVKTSWTTFNSGVSVAQDGIKVISGGMPDNGLKELPNAPPKENSTIELEKAAQELIDLQDWPKLAKHCQTWTVENNRSASAWYCYGRALAQMKEDKAAIVALKRASLLAPQNDNVRRMLRDVSMREMEARQLRNRNKSE